MKNSNLTFEDNFVFFCETIYKNFEGGIYYINENEYYNYILELYTNGSNENQDITDIVIEKYGLLFIVPSGNNKYKIKLIFEKKNNCNFKFDNLNNDELKKYIVNNIFKEN